MPDKNDPKYRERYEKDVEAGRKFAKAIKLDKGVSAIQRFASGNRNTFLVIVFIFVFISVALNIYRMTRAYSVFTGKDVSEYQRKEHSSEQSTRSITLNEYRSR